MAGRSAAGGGQDGIAGRGEELTTGDAGFADHEDAMDCACGPPSCRRRIDDRDRQRPDLQQRYGGWISSYLDRRIAGTRR